MSIEFGQETTGKNSHSLEISSHLFTFSSHLIHSKNIKMKFPSWIEKRKTTFEKVDVFETKTTVNITRDLFCKVVIKSSSFWEKEASVKSGMLSIW